MSGTSLRSFLGSEVIQITHSHLLVTRIMVIDLKCLINWHSLYRRGLTCWVFWFFFYILFQISSKILMSKSFKCFVNRYIEDRHHEDRMLTYRKCRLKWKGLRFFLDCYVRSDFITHLIKGSNQDQNSGDNIEGEKIVRLWWEKEKHSFIRGKNCESMYSEAHGFWVSQQDFEEKAITSLQRTGYHGRILDKELMKNERQEAKKENTEIDGHGHNRSAFMVYCQKVEVRMKTKHNKDESRGDIGCVGLKDQWMQSQKIH